MKTVKTCLIFLILLSFCFSAFSVAFAEEEVSTRGRLVKIDKDHMSILIKDSDDKQIEISFDDKKLFSKIEKYRLMEGDMISVKYVIKNKKNIGTKIRALKGC